MYKIIGGDGREYGPITETDLRKWIAEGRVSAHTLIQGEGQTTWRPISTFSEFASSFPGGGPAPFATPPPMAATPAALLLWSHSCTYRRVTDRSDRHDKVPGMIKFTEDVRNRGLPTPER